MGRPRIVIDPKLLKRLAAINCSLEEAATACGTVKRTLIRHLNTDTELKEAWEAGRNKGKMGLRRLQWKHAGMPNSAGVQMTIHMSKHMLGEHDRQLNMNMTVDDLDEAIRELERRAGETKEPSADKGEH